jgi:hypothetical protein
VNKALAALRPAESRQKIVLLTTQCAVLKVFDDALDEARSTRKVAG